MSADGPIPEEVEEVEEGAAWMATFADLMSLLLTFFVLLLSFANMDVQNFRTALGSVREAMGVQEEHPGDRPGLTTSILELSKRESTDNIDLLESEISARFEKFVKEQDLEEEIEIELGNRGVIVRVKDKLLFAGGEAELMNEAEAPLMAVATLAKSVDLPIWIQGHTDNRPINTLAYPSNWELSAARATAALRFLQTKGKVTIDRLSIAGYAHTRPIRSNTTAEGRAQNRRVEFVFIRSPDKTVDEYRNLLFKQDERARIIRESKEARERHRRRMRGEKDEPDPEPEPDVKPSAAKKGPIF